jgi:hypothetical protein
MAKKSGTSTSRVIYGELDSLLCLGSSRDLLKRRRNGPTKSAKALANAFVASTCCGLILVRRAKSLTSMAGALLKGIRPTMVGPTCSQPFIMALSLLFVDKAAEILATLCTRVSNTIERPVIQADSNVQESPTWRLKANVTVFRHADRTPKQKLKL